MNEKLPVRHASGDKHRLPAGHTRFGSTKKYGTTYSGVCMMKQKQERLPKIFARHAEGIKPTHSI